MVTILLIEDDKELRFQLRSGLESAEFQVIECVDGKEGMAKFQEEIPELVITDIVMENMEGIALILEIRKLDAQIPIISISGNERYLDNSKKLGATQALLKPFRMSELLTCVEKVLKG